MKGTKNFIFLNSSFSSYKKKRTSFFAISKHFSSFLHFFVNQRKSLMKRLLILLASVSLLFSCKSKPELKTGLWRAEVPTIAGVLPFHIHLAAVLNTCAVMVSVHSKAYGTKAMISRMMMFELHVSVAFCVA